MSYSQECPFCGTEVPASASVCRGCHAEYISRKELLSKKLLTGWVFLIFTMFLPVLAYLFGRPDENGFWLTIIIGLFSLGVFLSWIASITTKSVWRRKTLK